jgi:hypothetical protein
MQDLCRRADSGAGSAVSRPMDAATAQRTCGDGAIAGLDPGTTFASNYQALLDISA